MLFAILFEFLVRNEYELRNKMFANKEFTTIFILSEFTKSLGK